ncbi:aminoglycoside phosphotransferase (APT) family kinase protein [Prauserella sediminis]|uniref:Aminoglycoside phosphotransferase (APT) family kinase protein n=1 Tax=Prauserella sediminis TaxID=577680 RepID=A0A839XRX9_9PSEU|nr:aminoglycoside phosphotransferase family protein [Prauserella sediminis]MBB3662635.1 aminoglycoside phosphotransferase (APT) family kinase protein [Prauserella sediminis]
MCARLGADPRGATLLRFTNNAVYALADRPFVVRIVGTPALRYRASKVVRIARHLRQRGVPAVRLAAGVDQPVRVGEHLATVWERVPDTGRRATTDELADLLRTLHAAGAPDGGGADAWEPLADVRARVEAGSAELAAVDRGFLLDRCDELETKAASLEFPLARTLIHGDAHVGNVIVGPDGPVLCDFDSACVGPPEWDLVPVAVGCERFGDPPSRRAALAERYGFDVTAWEGFEVLRGMRELKLATSVLPTADRDPAVRREAHRRLADLKAGDLQHRWARYREG